MRNAFVLALIAVFFYFAARTSVGGMVTYWWFGIFRPQDWIYMDISSLRIPLLATILFFVPAVFRKLYPDFSHPLAKMMALWYVLAVVASVMGGCSDIFKVIDPLPYMFLLLYAVLLSVRVVETRQHLLYLVAIVALSLGFYAGKAGLSSLMSGGASSYGASNLKGIFTGSNAFGFGCAVLVFLNIFILQLTYKKEAAEVLPERIRPYARTLNWVMMGVVCCTIFNVVSLESRGNAIAIALGLLLLFLLNNKKIRKILVLVPILAITLPLVPLPEGYEERIASAFAEKDELEASAASRPHFWQVAQDMVKDYPLGVGPQCYREYYNLYDFSDGHFGRNRDVHSSHFQILADIGYMGALLWVSMFTYAYWVLFRTRGLVKRNSEKFENPFFYKHLCNALICSQSAAIFAGSFYSMGYNDLIWLNWGLAIIVSGLVNKELDQFNNQLRTNS